MSAANNTSGPLRTTFPWKNTKHQTLRQTEKRLALTEALLNFSEGLSTDQSHIRKLSNVDERLWEMNCEAEGGLSCSFGFRKYIPVAY